MPIWEGSTNIITSSRRIRNYKELKFQPRSQFLSFAYLVVFLGENLESRLIDIRELGNPQDEKPCWQANAALVDAYKEKEGLQWWNLHRGMLFLAQMYELSGPGWLKDNALMLFTGW